jgi:hypothetical protein
MNDLSVRGVSCFQENQHGGAIKELAWFTLLVGICGLAIIRLDEFRIDDVAQSTAGAAARATFVEFPFNLSESAAPASVTAVAGAQNTTPTDRNDEIAAMTSVVIGEWAHPRRDPYLPVSVY